MLLLQQTGSVKIGEVVRYTVTYTPSHDRILPSPEVLHLRIRNTSPLAFRAAFIHGPYTLNVSAYPSHYDPNTKFENPRRYGVPEFEPMLKAAGMWNCQLVVPDNIRESAGMGASRGDFRNSGSGASGEPTSASWIIEVASQVIFSSGAAVGYEVLLARDEKSLDLGSASVVGDKAQVPQPGKLSDFQRHGLGGKDSHALTPHKGVFSKAISMKVEDTASLWNTPQLPGWDDWDHGRSKAAEDAAAIVTSTKSEEAPGKPRRLKKVHLVVITHGIHGNLGGDMLYLKESIDATAKQAKIHAKERIARAKAEKDSRDKATESMAAEHADPAISESSEEEGKDDYEDEEVFVRGFSGNATRTERGIKFLGKRLARFVLSMTYPDQPFLPATKKATEHFAMAIRGDSGKNANGQPAHSHSTIHKSMHHEDNRRFQITSISFVAHSLGGLVQTYAIAYIQKHSPQFFDLIRPINFITLAAPLLGLSNENPLYVKFALDFGLVGRTGQDLGLTWRAPTIARSGWGALVGTLGESAHKKVMGDSQPESKPLLRILPTGPAHKALKKFRNRTVYSNVVNDGIVPLRTSCLLFLDWQGLDRVEKARREAGLMETMVGFGWAELTGTNVSTSRKSVWASKPEESPAQPKTEDERETAQGHSREVPQPPTNATEEDDRRSLHLATPLIETGASQNSQTNNDFPFSGFFNMFKNNEPKTSTQKTPLWSPRESKIYQRSQTLRIGDDMADSASSSRTKVSSGHELEENHENGVSAPPRTTFLESAGDILNPKMPSVEFLIDPSRRPRTIFHDRVYHPSDIPPPPLKRRSARSLSIPRLASSRSTSSSPKRGKNDNSSPARNPKPGVPHADSGLSTRDYDDPQHTDPDRDPRDSIDTSGMKVEEKIARAYHRDLSWRKVLVKLEPDAHNNIIVRRTFANAFGWPVIKHLVDAHFSDSVSARTDDDRETGKDQSKAMNEPPSKSGAETNNQNDAEPRNSEEPAHENHKETILLNDRPFHPTAPDRTPSEALEAADAVPDLRSSQDKGIATHSSKESLPRPSFPRTDSATWSDRDWADSDGESEIDSDMAYGRYHILQEQERRMEQSGKGKEKDTQSNGGGGGSSSSSWNWTEKIVGRGAVTKKVKGGDQLSPGPQSPVSPLRPENGYGNAGEASRGNGL